MAVEDLATWLASILAEGLSSIVGGIDEALQYANLFPEELNMDKFVDTFRGMQREQQFADMLANPNTPEDVKNSEFLEGDETMPRNYLAKFYVEYTDPETGDREEGWKSMYVDDRLSNSALEDMFLDKWVSDYAAQSIGFDTLYLDTITHSKGSPYASLR